MLLKETKSIFKKEGEDFVNMAELKGGLGAWQSGTSLKLKLANKEYHGEGRRRREQRSLNIYCWPQESQNFSRLLQLFNPIKKDYDSHFTGRKTQAQ